VALIDRKDNQLDIMSEAEKALNSISGHQRIMAYGIVEFYRMKNGSESLIEQSEMQSRVRKMAQDLGVPGAEVSEIHLVNLRKNVDDSTDMSEYSLLILTEPNETASTGENPGILQAEHTADGFEVSWKKQPDLAMLTTPEGGIDLRPSGFGVEIQRNGNMTVPAVSIPPEVLNGDFTGLIPVILNITPSELPLFFSELTPANAPYELSKNSIRSR